ncbi:uncharacterized protein A4U43_C03F4820 [Asparagus officinalis]|uniref:Sodium/calcium exchanger membrane region domain-containing protein n=1 Tax=Asparagus officinalis TaxID=4686 RepID=A0A5P1FBT9_ASPOF|nr:cation/calcium exchanger 1-like [Asparagus officinalis]ONK74299.1 uncharacterized protein A4U43_C03F4820 [Asparagus officinalis]
MASHLSPPKPHKILLNISFLLLIFLLFTFNLSSPQTLFNSHSINPQNCEEFDSLKDHKTKCFYIKANNPCSPQGYIDYLHLFYCVFGEHPFIGYSILALWLLVLFYLLGNTASVYFCSSLESISKLLRLPPTVAGVTLLSLGNGAPDAFSTIASFASSEVGEVGLSSVLGGAFFVTSVVVGVISVCVGDRLISVDRFSFVRDICFYVIVLCFLLGILIVGEIGVGGAIVFASLYIVYVVIVAISYCWRKNQREFDVPLLESIEIENDLFVPKLEVQEEEFKKPNWCIFLMYLLELPLYLPRRLTIPDVSEERWSKPFAISSVILSPILLATLWNSKRNVLASEESLTIYLFSALIGLVLGVIALETTETSKPPNKYLFTWLAGGFLMSIIWFYILAEELVSLLISIGHIFNIGPSILAVTVLAWGNSLGDLIANVAMALKGGEDGVQIAISGCYSVPIFNTLVGLGFSLVFRSWGTYPSPYVVPQDSTILVTLGFLVCGLLWALLILPKRGMKLDRVFGIGLLALYLCFLCLRICDSIGFVNIDKLYL